MYKAVFLILSWKSCSSLNSCHSIPSDQSSLWQQAPLASTQGHSPSTGNSSGLPDGHDKGTSDSQTSPISISSSIKLIVSNNVAGSIIGRSGQTISDLQSQSGTRIKLSQADDYYPGTQDRVCLVQGNPENVKMAMKLLLTRLFALQQQQHFHHFAWQRLQQERGIVHESIYGVSDTTPAVPVNSGFSFVVRILVPVPCCGMIIGKGGANIKQMVDASGVSAVRLSPKEGGDPENLITSTPLSPATSALVIATAERMVSISGPDLKSCLTCLNIILDGMTSHPDISRYSNMTTSYARTLSSNPNTLSVPKSSASTSQRLDQGIDPFFGGQDDYVPLRRSPSYGYLDRQSLTPSPHLGVPPSPTSARVDQMPRYFAFAGHAVPFLPQESPSRPPLQQMQNSPFILSNSNMASFQSSASHGESLRVPPSHSAPDLLALHMQNSLRMADHHLDASASLTYQGPSSFVHQLPQPTQSPPGFVVRLAIPENLIGSILGRGGRTLTELQALSDTRIRISQRGEYLPGTKSRVVTILGPTAQSVSTAQYLMNQHLVLPPSASTYSTASTTTTTTTTNLSYTARADYAATNEDRPPP